MPAIRNEKKKNDDEFYSAPSRFGSKKKGKKRRHFRFRQDRALTFGVNLSQSTAARSFNPCVTIASIAFHPFIPLFITFTL